MHQPTILVVDDIDAIRGLICEMLESAGYSVVSARNGREALDISAKHGDPINLLITDVEMPGMTGLMLAEALLKKHSRMRVLFISATGREVISSFRGTSSTQLFLQKPFTKKDLISRVEEALA